MSLRSIFLFFKITILVLLQVWVFNKLNLFRIATPYPYVYLLMIFPMGLSKVWRTFVSACVGLILDALSGTPGLHTAAFTFVGFLSAYLTQPFIDTDSNTAMPLSLRREGGGILFLLFLLIVIHHWIFFFLDALHLFNLSYFLIRLGSSIVLTFIISLTMLLLFGYQPRKRG